MIRVTVWNEGVHEAESREVAAVYPEGIHGQLKSFLGAQEDMEVRTATLREPDCGLPPEVLIWWGHKAHDEVPDELVERVHDRVLRGMGFIALHSAHFSKPFKRLMGTSCALHWRDGDFERVWTVNPAHPIAKGLDEYFEIPVEEMYGERFDIPEPDELVFLGWFSGGDVFRSGCCWNRGRGRVFYFQPGRAGTPAYYIPQVQQILTNAVRWAAPHEIIDEIVCPHAEISPEQKRNAR